MFFFRVHVIVIELCGHIMHLYLKQHSLQIPIHTQVQLVHRRSDLIVQRRQHRSQVP